MRNTLFIASLSLVGTLFSLNLSKNHSGNIINQTGEKILITDTGSAGFPEGYEYITNFNLDYYSRTVSITQDKNGTMLFLDKRGVIQFDGSDEKLIPIDGNPKKFKQDSETGFFYLICNSSYGVIKPSLDGSYQYHVISNSNNTSDHFFDIVYYMDNVLFVGENKIISVDKSNHQKSEVLFEDAKRMINLVFVFNDKLYINFYKSGFYNIDNKKVKEAFKDPILDENQIVFVIPDTKNLIFGLSNNTMIKFNGSKIKEFKTGSDEYIKESVITGASDHISDQFVIITLNGGVVIVDKKSGETLKTINYRTGLPDDEIYSAYTDLEGGLWLSHEYGVSRIGFDLPVKNYGHYPGLAGKISSAIVYNNTLYVGTGEGLFYLSGIKSYEEVKVATDKWIKTKVENQNLTVSNETFVNPDPKEDIQDISESNESDEAGFLSKWKKRKEEKKKEKLEKEELIEKLNQGIYTDEEIKDSRPDQTDLEAHEIEEDITELKKVTEYRKIYELQSVKYTFKKLEGINGKCRKLVVYKNALLAITNNGLFLAKGDQISTIIPNQYIYNVSGISQNNSFFVGTSQGIYRVKENQEEFEVSKLENNTFENISIKHLLLIDDSNFWATGVNRVYLINANHKRIISYEQFKLENDLNDEIRVIEFQNKVRFISGDNAYFYDDRINDLVIDEELSREIKDHQLIFLNDRLVPSPNRSSNKTNDNEIELNNLKFLNLIDRPEGGFVDHEDIWAYTSDNRIYRISNQVIKKQPFRIFFKYVEDNEGNRLDHNKLITIKSDYKKLKIALSSPFYVKNNFVSYFYSTNNEDESGFIEASGSEIIIPQLAPGKHTVYFYAINGLNDKSELIEFKLEIKPPFWKSYTFIIGVFLLFFILLFLGLSNYYKRKQRKIREYNEILELKVKERTAEISKQNELIRKQNEEITSQNEMIMLQHEEITGSIRYAEKIQKAVLTDVEFHSKYISGFFNLFLPRDIVSGDFYWMYEVQNKLVIAAADCTGHGVPGGFLSMLGISFLNEIVNESGRSNSPLKAAEILNALREKIITAISRHHEETAQDGMDISIVVIDREQMTLNFAGANNPAYISRNGILSKIEADRMPVGYNKKLNGISFTNKFVKIIENDAIYLFTDGYAEQFGGEYGKKFNVRRFREMLIHLQSLPMEKQKYAAEKILRKWRGDHMQIDDILLIGIKI
jgi:serine phosphatase RsbU (regulator of sigma subunit)/ligand-binding sensor domain-containing protein